MDALDRTIMNRLQSGIDIIDCPFAPIAAELGIEEGELLERLSVLQADGVLSRFGPMFNVEAMGGAYSLVAMKIADHDFERVAQLVNLYPEVAHNYARDHAFNMWFVVAAETERRITEVVAQIESETGYATYNMPKQEEYFIGLKFDA